MGGAQDDSRRMAAVVGGRNHAHRQLWDQRRTLTVAKSRFHSSTRSTPRGPEEMLLERTILAILAIIAGVSRRLRQMIQLMPQLSFLSSVEDSCSGSKSSSATACDASPCAPLYTIAELV